MSFSTDDFSTLVRLVEEHPEWRGNLRRLLLSDELLLLPEQFAQFRAQTDLQFRELGAALGRLTEQVQKLTEAQQRTDARLDALTEAQQRTEVHLGALAEAQRQTEEQILKLSKEMSVLTQGWPTLLNDVGGLKGASLEHEYRIKVFAYFSRVLNRPRVVGPEELTTLLADAVDTGALADAEAHEISLADIIVRGKHGKGGPEIYLVVEVFWGVGVRDVERAVQRAALLARLGTPVLPVVAGRWVSPDAEQLAHLSHVWQLRNGSAIPPTGKVP